jgi:ArsR family transcriptional regulator, arsenate/arsenite/antimonite-responsive transcriptional repressor
VGQLIVWLRAIADETRLRVFRLLAEFPEGLCVCEIADALGVPQYQASRALACLRETGLAHAHREGTWVRYTLAPGPSGAGRLAQVVTGAGMGSPEKADIARARQRLAFRRDGVCVIGYDDPVVRATLLQVEGVDQAIYQEGGVPND